MNFKYHYCSIKIVVDLGLNFEGHRKLFCLFGNATPCVL